MILMVIYLFQSIQSIQVITYHLSTGTKASSSQDKTEVEGIEGLTNSFQKLGGTWNLEMTSQFELDEASTLFITSKFLNGDDESSLNEHNTANSKWRYLKQKYSKTNKETANSYMTKIQIFRYNKENGIDRCW